MMRPLDQQSDVVTSRKVKHPDGVPSGSLAVVGYVRVSTDEQTASGAGLQAQRNAIEAEVLRRGWSLIATFEDGGMSGKSMDGRLGLQKALEAVERGDAAALVVSKVDRLSRSLADFANLMERSRRRGWALVALDLGIDTTTPSGEMMANVVASFSQYERRLVGQRTREALRVKRSQGVLLGRPVTTSPTVVMDICGRYNSGSSLAAIARDLNEQGTPTAQGGARWHASTVRNILKRVGNLRASRGEIQNAP